jgi:hypothetical protein
MHFFGLYGTLFFLVGFIMIIYLVVAKIIAAEFALTNRPSFYISMTTMIIGMQLFLAGFIGELISRNSPDRNSYLIEKKVGFV